ncbi:MAG: hypothetical protein SGJ07_14660 [Rhodospirillaceae bacterium]|nr:hypothetical protein [Rhodospirillaceae bacterium]
MKAFKRLWRGDVPLADAIWNWAIFGGLAINLGTLGLFLWLLSADRPIVAFILGYAFTIPYNIVVTVGVWRSAGRFTGEQRWADLARIATPVWMLILTII